MWSLFPVLREAEGTCGCLGKNEQPSSNQLWKGPLCLLRLLSAPIAFRLSFCLGKYLLFYVFLLHKHMMFLRRRLGLRSACLISQHNDNDSYWTIEESAKSLSLVHFKSSDLRVRNVKWGHVLPKTLGVSYSFLKGDRGTLTCSRSCASAVGVLIRAHQTMPAP